MSSSSAMRIKFSDFYLRFTRKNSLVYRRLGFNIRSIAGLGSRRRPVPPLDGMGASSGGPIGEKHFCWMESPQPSDPLPSPRSPKHPSRSVRAGPTGPVPRSRRASVLAAGRGASDSMERAETPGATGRCARTSKAFGPMPFAGTHDPSRSGWPTPRPTGASVSWDWSAPVACLVDMPGPGRTGNSDSCQCHGGPGGSGAQ